MELRDARVAPMSGDRQVGKLSKLFADGTTPEIKVQVALGTVVTVDAFGVWDATGAFRGSVPLGAAAESFHNPGLVSAELGPRVLELP